jgi:hypothetical protein
VPPQFDSPVPQLTVQLPDEHTWPALHVTPHAPQFELSLPTSRHTPPQFVWPPPQVTVQALPAQT